MSVTQSIEAALEKNVGPHGVADAALSGALARTEAALDRLRQHYTEGTLPLLRLPEKQDDLEGIREAAARLKDGASDIVILGTGGSSLGGQTLAQLAGVGVPGVGLLRAAEKLLHQLRPAVLLVTLGELGMLLCERGRPPFHIPTVAQEVFDVSGAGDTVIATFTLAIAAGASPVEAAIISNHAAGIVVGKIGTATVTPEELVANFRR